MNRRGFIAVIFAALGAKATPWRRLASPKLTTNQISLEILEAIVGRATPRLCGHLLYRPDPFGYWRAVPKIGDTIRVRKPPRFVVRAGQSFVSADKAWDTMLVEREADIKWLEGTQWPS